MLAFADSFTSFVLIAWVLSCWLQFLGDFSLQLAT